MELHSFIVRIWFETTEVEDRVAAIRGSIEDVSTHEMLHFCRLDSIHVFIRKQMKLEQQRFPGKWRVLLNRFWHGE